jgi:tetratricopeptide (TPR) repeat protein/predicted MFS family arabinose efflux permease
VLRARNPRAAMATVIAEGFLGRLTFGMVSFALPLYALHLGLSLGEIGILISIRTVIALGLKPVAGWASDRVGVRAVYLAGTFARVLAAATLFFADSLLTLTLVRFFQAASAAGRDVASLGAIARDADNRVGTIYSWYASAKHVGGVAGAGVAGLIIATSGGGFQMLFALVFALSVLPTVGVWFGLREVRDEKTVTYEPMLPPEPETQLFRSRMKEFFRLLRALSGPASVGMLIAASAYMVHGLFPILATEYAGLSTAQAGIIYSLSAAVFLVAGPFYGWITDRYGRLVGIASRSAANIGSSVMYLVSPTFVGMAAARSVDDVGKAAFRPAWASAITDIAAKDPPRKGRRLGTLDAMQEIGEIAGPALAGILWQTGGVFVLFGVRIAIAIVAEISAIAVFGELRNFRPRLRFLPWARKNRRRESVYGVSASQRQSTVGHYADEMRATEAEPWATFHRGSIFDKQGEYDRAAEAYQRVLDSRHPEAAPRAAFNLGMLLEERGEYDRAVEAYRQAIDSEHAEWASNTVFDLGMLFEQMGKYDLAEEAYQRTIDSEHAEWAPKAAFNLGLMLDKQGKYDLAEEAYQRAIDSKHPEEAPRAAFDLGILFEVREEYHRAEEAYQWAIDSRHPEEAPRAAFNLGLMLDKQGKYDLAEEAYQRAIDSEHAEWAPKAAFNLGILFEEREEYHRAEEAYQRAIDSEHPDAASKARLNLGVIFEQRGAYDLAEAEEAYQQAINSGHPEVAPKGMRNLRGLPLRMPVRESHRA